MPGVYEKMGIRFLYPDNWTLDEDEALAGNTAVTVYSPRGAFWSVTVHPPGTDTDELAATAIRALKAEYPDSETEPVVEKIVGHEVGGYDMNFFYLDLTNTAVVLSFRTPTASCLVLWQAEDREYEELGPVFRAITTSLLTPS